MNIVNKLTWRQMKKNKRQTLVTIIGVIISVAMVTGVATLAVSFVDLLQRQTIEDTGEWHVEYESVNDEQLAAIEDDSQTENVFLSRDIGYATLENSENDYKPYVYLTEFNDEAFKQYPLHVTEGRLPETAHEVLLTEHIEGNGNVTHEIGDEITWDLGDRVGEQGVYLDQTYGLEEEEGHVLETLETEETRTVTVVGFVERPNWEPTWSPSYSVISYLDDTVVSAENPVNAFVDVKKVNRGIYKSSENLAADLKIDSYTMNHDLLRYSGVISNDGVFAAMAVFVSIIMLIIMVGSVSLIYNAFAISVSERSRHLGMLSSVGATKKQKRNSVFFEGLVIGLISIPIGIASGIIGMAVTFYFINDRLSNLFDFSEKLTVAVTPFSIVLACVISLITIFISAYIPARRASRVSAIDAIRQSMDVKLTGKSVKTSKLVRWLFGFEAEIGLKNLKRNKKRYLATVFSLMISIILFLSVAYFTSSLEKVTDITQEGYNYDIEMSMWEEDLSETDRTVIEDMKDIEGVTESSLATQINLNYNIDTAEVPDVVLNEVYGHLDHGEIFTYYVNVHVLEDETLVTFAEENKVDFEDLQATDKMTAILIDKAIYEDSIDGTYSEIPSLRIDLGETIPLSSDSYSEEEKGPFGDIEIVGKTGARPMGVSQTSFGNLDLIVSEETYEQIRAFENVDTGIYYFYVSSSDPLKTGDKMEALSLDHMRVHNHYQASQEDKQLTFIMSVFIYGFITLITLISIANIFNTISTSISLRKREFGMLKSVGMTPRGFNKMLRYESIFYGIKSLLYGLPISVLFMYLMHHALSDGIIFKFTLPWLHIAGVVVAVFLIVGLSMLYSSSKMKKENIIDALKQDNL